MGFNLQQAPLKQLAIFLHDLCKDDPLQMAESIVLLPSRRAVRQFIEELRSHTSCKTMILPQVKTLKDWVLQKDNFSLNLYPPVSLFERELHFIQLMKSHVKEETQAIHFAESLATLHDEFILEEISLERLKTLIPEEFALHWQENLKFLEIIKDQWPKFLNKIRRSDPCIYFMRVLNAQIEAWKNVPFQTPIIAAGLEDHLPIVKRLLTAIEHLPKGKVYRNSFGDQSSYKTLITQDNDSPQKLQLGEFSSLDEEARTIALLIRECLEDPQKTVALVTPLRFLAKRVVSELTRWNLTVDDSYGESLLDMPFGNFLRLSLTCVLNDFESIPFLSLLKHPYLSQIFKKYNSKLELQYMRGRIFTTHISQLLKEAHKGTELHHFLSQFIEWSSYLKNLLLQTEVKLKDLLEAHLKFIDILSQDSLVQQRGYKEFKEYLKGFEGSLSTLTIKGGDYHFLLEKLLDQITLRPLYGTHPRVFIWGPLEAQLQTVDCIILGGMNEKNWPGAYQQNAWLNDTMRKIIGLQTRRDWYQLKKELWYSFLKAPEIILTRAIREEGQIETPSRWWLTLIADLKAKRTYEKHHLSSVYRQWAKSLDYSSERHAILRPNPCPPLEARPRTLSVTQIETWIRDPYAIYAREILKLKPLPVLEPELGPALFGVMIHKILEEFFKGGHAIEDPQAFEIFCTLGRDIFGESLHHPVVSSFWWTRYTQVIRWFLDVERTSGPLKRWVEVQGELMLEGPYGLFKLKATADRIDFNAEGVACIIDYKTGRLPTRRDIEQGIMPQLPLEAAILKQGGFYGLESHASIVMRYMHLSGGQPPGTVLDLPGSELFEEALERLQAMIVHYDQPQNTYPSCPDSEIAPLFSAYHHLSRIQEWQRL